MMIQNIDNYQILKVEKMKNIKSTSSKNFVLTLVSQFCTLSHTFKNIAVQNNFSTKFIELKFVI